MNERSKPLLLIQSLNLSRGGQQNYTIDDQRLTIFAAREALA
jgi:hypothetical protein